MNKLVVAAISAYTASLVLPVMFVEKKTNKYVSTLIHIYIKLFHFVHMKVSSYNEITI